MESTDAKLNKEKQRFELTAEGKLSVLDFRMMNQSTLALIHTEVHPDLEGKGVGSALVESVLTYAEQHGQKVVPVCPFVAVYIKRHPAWERVVSNAHSADDF